MFALAEQITATFAKKFEKNEIITIKKGVKLKNIKLWVNIRILKSSLLHARSFLRVIRQVGKIHFYNYNRSWYLDVEVTFNDAFCINKMDVERLQKQYGCHDFDDDLKQMEATKVPDEERPWLFFFVCGKVLGTDLK